MPIAINGNGTVTGVSVGGLPDGIVDADMLASNAVTAGKLASGVGGKFASYAIICDQKSAGTAGGTPPNTSSFNTRDLNTELADADGIVSISSNQFTLQAGTYLLRASVPAYKPQRSQAMIYNVTDSSVTGVGTGEYGPESYAHTIRSMVVCRTTISGAKVFDVRHRVGYVDATFGYGVDGNYGQPEIYTIVEIFKEA
tara:strand:- start:345 stop:938 length:594 start_codon:yes stop_codon:yes gene_type:complete